MPDKKIKTEIKCQNIAPIESLTKEVTSGSLKFGVFANNGSGKTFISRMFRLTENLEEVVLDEDCNSPTDKLITLGRNTGSFDLKITDKNDTVTEHFKINLNKKSIPTIPGTEYLFHTFNEDYVEDNLRSLDYDKDNAIDGYILGKVNIDLSDDEDKLEKIWKKITEVSSQIQTEIDSYVSDKIDDIQNIKRLNEYKELNSNKIISSIDKDSFKILKTYDELVDDYNKIKSVPENLPDISNIGKLSTNLELLEEIIENCAKEYSLSMLAEDFKSKIKSKQTFIETGIELVDDNEKECPFCEQSLEYDALRLIDSYNKYLNDVESSMIRRFENYKKSLENLLEDIERISINNVKAINSFNTYKKKYIPSSNDIELKEVITNDIKNEVGKVIGHITSKLQNLSLSIKIDEEIEKYQRVVNSAIESNNIEINAINKKKNRINDENRSIRKQICKRAFNDLVQEHKTKIKSLEKLKADYSRLNRNIEKKKEQRKVSKKKEVATTIKSVLNYFFANKYTLDEDTFRLTFKANILEKKQAKDILSAGEKNIIAFAYYIGDTHLKVNSEEDYKKLFFIIDDPISSMDFSHVYTVCGVIRDIKKILDKVGHERIIIFTHNNDFMRILSSNNIIDKKLLLTNGALSDFNNNLTVPYISHLLDIYKIARKDEIPTHTTANSIRHLIETLTKFERIEIHRESIADYIKTNIPDDTKAYTLINDLSHGGWRTEQAPITNADYREVCELVIKHIEKKFDGQIAYCKTIC